jgi:hypothetical protein
MKITVAVGSGKASDSGIQSGSGGVAVVPLERGGPGGHFDTCLRMAVAVLAELLLLLFFLR